AWFTWNAPSPAADRGIARRSFLGLRVVPLPEICVREVLHKASQRDGRARSDDTPRSFELTPLWTTPFWLSVAVRCVSTHGRIVASEVLSAATQALPDHIGPLRDRGLSADQIRSCAEAVAEAQWRNGGAAVEWSALRNTSAALTGS